MTNKERNIIKSKILKCLTEDFKNNQAIFDKKEGHAIYTETNLRMVMDKVVKGLEFAKEELVQTKHINKMEIAKLIGHNIEVAAMRLSENLIYYRHIEKDRIEEYKKAGLSPERVLMVNNEAGKHDLSARNWNLYFEGRKHYVVVSWDYEQMKDVIENMKKIK